MAEDEKSWGQTLLEVMVLMRFCTVLIFSAVCMVDHAVAVGFDTNPSRRVVVPHLRKDSSERNEAVDFDTSPSRRVEVPHLRKESSGRNSIYYWGSKSADKKGSTSTRPISRSESPSNESSLLPADLCDANETSMGAPQKVLNGKGRPLEQKIVEFGVGRGETSDQALKEAMRDVLEKVVGIYVDAEFRMNNDQSIKEEIITHSNGFIDHYEKVAEADDTNGKGKIATIKAWVKMRDFVNSVNKIAPSPRTKVDGVLIDAHLENDVSAEALLRKEIEAIDPVSMFDVRLLEPCQPEIVSVDGNMVTMRYLYVVRYSKEGYYNKFLPRIKRVLNQICIKKNTKKTLSLSVAKIGMYPRTISSISDSYSNESWKERPQTAYICVMALPPNDGSKDKKSVAIADKINRSGKVELTRWWLSDRHLGVLSDSMCLYVAKRSKMRCKFSLFDEHNEIVSSITLPVDEHALIPDFSDQETAVPDFLPLLPNSGFWDRTMDSDSYSKVVSLHNGSSVDVADRFIGYFDVKVGKGNVKRIKTAEITFEIDAPECVKTVGPKE